VAHDWTFLSEAAKANLRLGSKKPLISYEIKGFENCYVQMGWLMGLEPTTTRITIWDSTN